MKSFIASAILVLAATAAASNDAAVTVGAPVGIEVQGRIVEMQPVQVTVRQSARAAPRAEGYYVSTSAVTFGQAYTLCRSLGMNLVTPKTAGEQTNLASMMTDVNLDKAWLGAMCSGNDWIWLADGTKVTYNNFVGRPTVLPSCGSFPTTSAMIINGNHFTIPVYEWFFWNALELNAQSQVICQY